MFSKNLFIYNFANPIMLNIYIGGFPESKS